MEKIPFLHFQKYVKKYLRRERRENFTGIKNTQKEVPVTRNFIAKKEKV